MEIRKSTIEDLQQLVQVYKSFFPVHVIFTRSDEEILSYLQNLKGDILVALDNNKVVGGLVIQKKVFGHVVAEFKHIAAKGGLSKAKEVIKELVEKAESFAGAAKIEFNIADGERVKHLFFKKLGYTVEAKLASHYRLNETCYILGKVINHG